MAGKKSRKSKKSQKPLTAASFSKHTQKRARKHVESAKKRAQHYSRGDKLLKKASKTLQMMAAAHPNPKTRKQAKSALRQLNDAHTAFGSASMCADSPTFNDSN